MNLVLEKAKVAYSTASACIRPITGGMGPDNWLPCKDLETNIKTIEGTIKKSKNSLKPT